MSKPPFKSGGPKRGGGGSRDGSSRDGSFRSGPRGGNSRGDAPRDRGARGESRYGDGTYSTGREDRRGDKPTFHRGPRKPEDAKPYGSKPSGDRGREDRGGFTRDGQRGDRPAYGRGPRKDDGAKPYGSKPYGGKPYGANARSDRDSGDYGSNERPWSNRNRDDRRDAPQGARSERPAYGRGPRKDDDRKTFGGKPYGSRDGGERPRSDRFAGDRFGKDHFANDRPRDDRPREERRPRPVRAAPRAAAPTAKTPGMPVREGERIAKLLARAGVASRREAERLIIEGRVRLGEDLIETPSTVLPNLRGVTVDGNPVRDAEETRLFIFHKPSGLITAERDPMGRPTIYTALRNALPDDSGRVMPIGRLDLNTEGLLLLTNDGEFKRQLELPATGVPRTYRARTFGDISQAQLEDLIEGIEIEGVVYGKIDANMERRTGRNQWVEMTLTEGKNREVRRVLEHLGLQVSRLIRISYGPFRLLDLPKGMVVEVSPRELENFRRTLPDAKA